MIANVPPALEEEEDIYIGQGHRDQDAFCLAVRGSLQ
jgi:hypothetical protein